MVLDTLSSRFSLGHLLSGVHPDSASSHPAQDQAFSPASGRIQEALGHLAKPIMEEASKHLGASDGRMRTFDLLDYLSPQFPDLTVEQLNSILEIVPSFKIMERDRKGNHAIQIDLPFAKSPAVS